MSPSLLLQESKGDEECLKDGWLHIGDMAMRDEDGFIYLVDRKKDVIISGGRKYLPCTDRENFLSKYEKIMDVAVIGIADARLERVTRPS